MLRVLVMERRVEALVIYSWQGQGVDDFWDDDETDEHAGSACIEGLIDDFLHGE
jgi:hypothetical protein